MSYNKMKEDEAIVLLSRLAFDITNPLSVKEADAMNMAIEALKSQKKGFDPAYFMDLANCTGADTISWSWDTKDGKRAVLIFMLIDPEEGEMEDE